MELYRECPVTTTHYKAALHHSLLQGLSKKPSTSSTASSSEDLDETVDTAVITDEDEDNVDNATLAEFLQALEETTALLTLFPKKFTGGSSKFPKGIEFTSIHCSRNVELHIHTDPHNIGNNYIITFGSYKAG